MNCTNLTIFVLILDIQSKKIDVAEFVEELGPALTSQTVEIRAKGTRMLSDTLNSLPVDFLNETQLNFITSFYCDRLKDHHSVIPAVILGILVISKMKNLPENSCVKLLTIMFQNIVCQSQLRDDRSNIFQIFKVMSENRQEGKFN